MLNLGNQSAGISCSPTDVARDLARGRSSALLEVTSVSSSDLTDGLLEDPVLLTDALATFEATFKELYSFLAVSPLDFHILLYCLAFPYGWTLIFPFLFSLCCRLWPLDQRSILIG